MFIKLTLLDTDEFIRINVNSIDAYHPFVTMDGLIHSKVFVGAETWTVHENNNEIDVKIKKAHRDNPLENVCNRLQDIAFTIRNK